MENIQEADIQAVIDARIEAIREAHANNLIEGLDMGADVFEAMLERARQPISNEEFTRCEYELWLQRHNLRRNAQPGDGRRKR